MPGTGRGLPRLGARLRPRGPPGAGDRTGQGSVRAGPRRAPPGHRSGADRNAPFGLRADPRAGAEARAAERDGAAGRCQAACAAHLSSAFARRLARAVPRPLVEETASEAPHGRRGLRDPDARAARARSHRGLPHRRAGVRAGRRADLARSGIREAARRASRSTLDARAALCHRRPAGVSNAGAALAACGLLGLAYALLIVRTASRQTIYKPVLEDWIWHGVLPIIAYALLLVASMVVRHQPAPALFAIGGSALLLLFIGIHTAWDAATYGPIDPPENAKASKAQ